MAAKRDIRTTVLSVRAAMTADEVQKKSRIICQNLIKHPLFLRASEIYCYVDFRNEVMTGEIMEASWKRGKKVAVPKVAGDKIIFYYITSRSELAFGSMGILEPTTTHRAEGKEALVIMPGAAFDNAKNRIGYGGGYYDRYMNSHPFYDSIALAFSCQIVDTIPNEAHDFKPEYILTEADKTYD